MRKLHQISTMTPLNMFRHLFKTVQERVFGGGLNTPPPPYREEVFRTPILDPAK